MAWKTLLSNYVFACLENRVSPIALLGVPFDATSTYRPGSRYAPLKIREASCNIELYSIAAQIILEDVGFKDYGDIVLPPGDVTKALERIQLVTKTIVRDHEGLLVALGGEHLITYSTVSALESEVDSLVIFDAHLDTRAEYLGSTLNHATFLRKLADRGFKVVHIGSRAYSKEELEYASSMNNIRVIDIFNLYSGNALSNFEFDKLGRVYVSIDVDVFDPSIAPGVSNPEPFGLDHRLFLRLLKEIFEKSDNAVMVDIVEVNPLVDAGDVTSILAAKIAIEASGLYLKSKQPR